MTKPKEYTSLTAARDHARERVVRPSDELPQPQQLYWHCACGMNEKAQPEYKYGDWEPCVHCQRGTAHVMTLKEAAEWEQAGRCRRAGEACARPPIRRRAQPHARRRSRAQARGRSCRAETEGLRALEVRRNGRIVASAGADNVCYLRLDVA